MSVTGELDCTLALALGTEDRERAARWYQQTLGLEQVYDNDDLGFCELATPIAGVTIVLSEVEAVQHGGGAVPTFGVRDIAAARAALEADGVRFDGDTQEVPGVVRLATLYDADGNALMLSQDLQKYPAADG